MTLFPFNEDHSIIRDTVRSWLKEWDDNGQSLHRISKSGQAFDAAAWKTFAQEQGMAGISIPEKYGGAGLGHLGRAIIMEEMGYVLFPAPFFSTCVICSDIIEHIADTDIKSEWLQKIAAGETIMSFVDARHLSIDDGFSGDIDLVTDGQFAEYLIIALPTQDAEKTQLVITPSQTDKITILPCQTLDPLRAMAKVTFLDFSPDKAEHIATAHNKELDSVLSIAYGALAAECVGGAQRCLDMTLEYTAQRIQFDRAINTFQAIKHRCADMFVNLESARSAAYCAAHAETTSEQLEYYLIAKPYASDAFFKISGDAIQLHGGIGFTWEYPLHYFFKRARANKNLFHSVEYSYDQLASLIEGAA